LDFFLFNIFLLILILKLGPFDKHGSLLVALCSAYGTDYCDITGEVSWVRDMI
jgi:short subunit dehydrogenase-like uncharacterized protein